MRRLADIGQFAARMAHEVRNALAAIKGAAQILHGEKEAQGETAEFSGIILAEVEGLNRLTIEVLDFARPTQLDPRPLEMESFLMSAVQSLQSYLSEHRIAVHWQIDPDLPEIEADRVLLGQVVRNIVNIDHVAIVDYPEDKRLRFPALVNGEDRCSLTRRKRILHKPLVSQSEPLGQPIPCVETVE